MITKYDPNMWYWFVGGDRTQAFYSSTSSFVLSTDITFNAWLTAGNVPTNIDTLDNLKGVLHDAGVPPFASVSMWQARKALRQAGLIDQVDAVMQAATPEYQDAWEYAATLRQTDPIVVALATQLNFTSATVNSLFTLAFSL